MNALAQSTSQLPYTIDRSQRDNAAEFVLNSYLMHVRSHRCCACGVTHQSSSLLEVWVHKNSANRTAGRRLVEATTFDPKVELGVSHLPIRDIPLCFLCVASQLETAASPHKTEAQLQQEWAQTIRRKYAPTQIAPKAEPPRASQEELLDLL